MGMVIDGQWTDQTLEAQSACGKDVRQVRVFRDWVMADGSTPFLPEKDRYHLYVSFACPWAHRVLVMRTLKKLEPVISVSIVDPIVQDYGWSFGHFPGSSADTVNQTSRLYEVYQLADPHYTGWVTVPVLWDKQQQTIVNNESAEIMRMLNSSFSVLSGDGSDYYPESLRADIDWMNDYVLDHINSGVFKCGLARTQASYEEAFAWVFEGLDYVEDILSRQDYLVGNVMTEADWRLFTTLIRFDAVFYGHFKCNKCRIADYPALSVFLNKLYAVPGIKETVNLEHVKHHYYGCQRGINPTGIVPLGPEIAFI